VVLDDYIVRIPRGQSGIGGAERHGNSDGFSSGVSVVSSKALPVAVNLAGRAGISLTDKGT
jgi:hypothetical protein